jgi:hypothetical protein
MRNNKRKEVVKIVKERNGEEIEGRKKIRM